MHEQTGTRTRLGRSGWVMLASITILSVLAGSWHATGAVATRFWVLLFPPALGLPAFIPPLRVAPLGETTWLAWSIDLLGVIVMLAAAIVWLLAAANAHPAPRRLRLFWRGVGVTTVAVVAGNLVRGVGQSFLLHSDLATFAGQMLANIAISALTGAVVGLVVGLLASVTLQRSDRLA